LAEVVIPSLENSLCQWHPIIRLPLTRLSAHQCDVPRSSRLEIKVNKMIKVFGAQIEPADTKVIIDYLAANYGSGS
jgi:hypothetical protein